MKKLFGLAVAMMLGLSVVGCDEASEQQNIELQDTNIEIEQQVEETDTDEEEITEEKQVEIKEEIVEEEPEILTIENNEEYKRIMTTSLSEDEYKQYFDNLDLEQEIEIEATIVTMNLREGYDTRFEMLLVCGDTVDSTVGPYIKVKDIQAGHTAGMTIGTKVRIKADYVDYDIDYGWLELDSVYKDEIETR